MPATLSKASTPKEKEEGMPVDEGVASPTSAVSSSEEDPLASKSSGKMRGFSQEGDEAKDIDNPKKRLSFKGDTPGKEGGQNHHQTPVGKKRNKQTSEEADEPMGVSENPTAASSGAPAAAAEEAAQPAQPAPSWVTPEELIGIRDTVNKLDKRSIYQGDVIDGHTGILKQTLFDKRKDSDIKTSLSYEIGGLPTEANHEEKARYIMSLMTKADIPSHEVANLGYKALARGTEVWGLEFRSNGVKPKLDKATKLWGDCYFNDGKGNTNSTWWTNKIDFIWPEQWHRKVLE